mmetsp:Transcript_98983/g.221035  ORF Transcript_98983/g.221035 Transcript_98983/m.221035 type:complete len:419 (+) Transcript_98983:74-1330(+)
MERYERLQVLGRGSFSTVLLARIREGPAGPAALGSSGTPAGASAFELSGALRVVKEVDLAPEKGKKDDTRRAEALREAEMLKSLSHLNIVAYHDAFLAGSKLCIVMEYADGGDLAGAIAKRRAAGRRYLEREAMAVFVQLVMALAYIHERRILHRDLKSKNTFLTCAGVVKLGDFGIAKVLENANFAETRIGTPYYLPPEMCSNRPYDFRADVWCLGIVLYELLALDVPFSAKTVVELAAKICNMEPHPVPSVYSSDLRALLARMMAKNAEDRPSSADLLGVPHVRRSAVTLLAAATASQGSRAVVAPAAPLSPETANGAALLANGGTAVSTAVGGTTMGADGGEQDSSAPEVDLEALLAGLATCDLGMHTPEGGSGPSSPQSGAAGGQVATSLRQALESTFSCEKLLDELALELDLA